MAQLIEISAPSAPTPTAKLFELGSDAIFATASLVIEATNRNLYVATFAGIALNTYLMVLYTAGVKFANRYVTINAADGTFTEVNDPLSSIILSSFTYSPVDAAITVQEGTICRGDGTPLRFVADPAMIINQNYWKAYIGTCEDNAIPFSVALNNMTVDEATGVILINPTSAQTLALPIGIVQCELWRTGVGDDNECRVALVDLTVQASLKGA